MSLYINSCTCIDIAQLLNHLADDVTVASSMETVLPYFVVLVECIRYGVSVSRRRQGLMEGGVEYSHLIFARKSLCHAPCLTTYTFFSVGLLKKKLNCPEG